MGIDSTATATITVNPVNDPPSAADDAFSVAEDSATSNLGVLGNDTIAPDTGETLTLTDVSAGSNGGSVSIGVGGRSIDYTPASDFLGSETFTYTVNDGAASSDATASVTINVLAKLTGPVQKVVHRLVLT